MKAKPGLESKTLRQRACCCRKWRSQQGPRGVALETIVKSEAGRAAPGGTPGGTPGGRPARRRQVREPGSPRSRGAGCGGVCWAGRQDSGGGRRSGSPREAAERRGGGTGSPPTQRLLPHLPRWWQTFAGKSVRQTGVSGRDTAAAPRRPAGSSEGTMFYPINLFLHQFNPCLVLDKVTDLKNE